MLNQAEPAVSAAQVASTVQDAAEMGVVSGLVRLLESTNAEGVMELEHNALIATIDGDTFYIQVTKQPNKINGKE